MVPPPPLLREGDGANSAARHSEMFAMFVACAKIVTMVVAHFNKLKIFYIVGQI